MSAPLTESVLIAVSRLVDDAMVEKREPRHHRFDELIKRFKLTAADPRTHGRNDGKAKRVRAVLTWALEHDVEGGSRFIASLIAEVRGCGGFREGSPNYVGAEPIADAIAAFKAEGFDLGSDGELRPFILVGLSGTEMTAALMNYVRRARQGVTDAALVAGTGKDLLEATAKHVLVEKWGKCPETTFPALLGQAYVALGMLTSTHPKADGETPQQTLDRALYDAAVAINRLRNKEGTGHGRPWLPSITEIEARHATELMGIIAERLLNNLKS